VQPKKYITAESQDLAYESSRFHEFASDEPQEDDWIRHDKYAIGRRLTIDDTLKKELAFRKLGKECEEEVEQEEEDEADDIKAGDDNEEDEDEDDVDDEDDVEAEEDEEDELEDDHSGYGSDNEVGFASSDDEDDDLVLWTTRQSVQSRMSGATPVCHRRTSISEQSDSSSYSGPRRHQTRPKNRELVHRFRPGTPELPDSTDFVCGTLDEDRPIEAAYMSCLAARKLEKQYITPQDIDPSFPVSEPEDDDVAFKSQPHGSDDHLWLHGELEDLHHGQERMDRRKKKTESPKRYHSPPPRRHHSPAPKRHHSPAPKARGRSPRRLPEHSPRRMRSPAPQLLVSPPASLMPRPDGGIVFKNMAWAPGLTQTKSLPRAPAVFRHVKPHKRGRPNTATKDAHVRGAVDIVMGLEQKRRRRREKFQQKYCNRARKGQVHEKRPQPGVGAERMRELGLILAGKTEQGNYVLSF